MDYQDINATTIPERYAVTIHMTIPHYEDENGAVISWVNDNGYECAGPMFNIYHVSPHETQNPDEYVTEVCYAVK